MTRFSTVFFALLIVNSVGLLFLPSTEAAAMVECELDQENLVIDVSPDGDGQGTFSGKLSLTFPKAVERAEVILDPEGSDHIVFQLSDYVFTLTKERPEASFIGNLSIARATSASIDGRITITGSVKVYPGGIETAIQSDYLDIMIKPFYGAILYFDTPFGKMNDGEDKTYSLILNNTGNAADTYTLKIVDKDDLRSQGVIVEIQDPSVDLAEKGSVQVPVKVRTRNADRGSYLIEVIVVSAGRGTGDPEPGKGAMTLTVEEKIVSFFQGYFSNVYVIYTTVAGLFALFAVMVLTISWYRKRRVIRRGPIEALVDFEKADR